MLHTVINEILVLILLSLIGIQIPNRKLDGNWIILEPLRCDFMSQIKMSGTSFSTKQLIKSELLKRESKQLT